MFDILTLKSSKFDCPADPTRSEMLADQWNCMRWRCSRLTIAQLSGVQFGRIEFVATEYTYYNQFDVLFFGTSTTSTVHLQSLISRHCSHLNALQCGNISEIRNLSITFDQHEKFHFKGFCHMPANSWHLRYLLNCGTGAVAINFQCGHTIASDT